MIEKYVLPEETSILALKSKTKNYAFKLDFSSFPLLWYILRSRQIGLVLIRVNWEISSRPLGQAQTRLAKRQVEQILGLQQKLLGSPGPNDTVKFNTYMIIKNSPFCLTVKEGAKNTALPMCVIK